MAQSKNALRALRKRFKLGEFSPGAKRSRRKSVKRASPRRKRVQRRGGQRQAVRSGWPFTVGPAYGIDKSVSEDPREELNGRFGQNI